MGWFGRVVAAVAALFLVAACDPSGQAYEDLRLARLKVGESTEQDVLRLFGPPAAVRTLPAGKGLVYPLGPEGAHTLLLRIGADGRYQGRENLLTRENFGRVGPGLSGEEVTALLGPPGRVQRYRAEEADRVGVAFPGWHRYADVRGDVRPGGARRQHRNRGRSAPPGRLIAPAPHGLRRATALRMPRRISNGGGGQPGTATSTGMTLATRPRLA